MSAIKLQKSYLVKLHNKQHEQQKLLLQQQQQQQKLQHEPKQQQPSELLAKTFDYQFISFKYSKQHKPCHNFSTSTINNYSSCLENGNSNSFSKSNSSCIDLFKHFVLNLCHYFYFLFHVCILYPATAVSAYFKYFTTNYVKSYCHIKRHGVNNNKTLCWLTLTLILLSGIWNTPNNGLVVCQAFDIGKYYKILNFNFCL